MKFDKVSQEKFIEIFLIPNLIQLLKKHMTLHTITYAFHFAQNAPVVKVGSMEDAKLLFCLLPGGKDGSICKEVVYCAKKAGVTHILKARGAQTNPTMAWGTSSFPKVEKNFGHGNQCHSCKNDSPEQ